MLLVINSYLFYIYSAGSGRTAWSSGASRPDVVGNVILHDKLSLWKSSKGSVHYHQGTDRVLSDTEGPNSTQCCHKILILQLKYSTVTSVISLVCLWSTGVQWSVFVVYRSSGRGQHPERPLFSPGGSVSHLRSFHRRLSAGRSSRRSVGLRPLPDLARLAPRHLRRVLPPLVLCRLAGRQTDVAPSGGTNAAWWTNPAAAVFLSLLVLVFVLIRFWRLQKNVPGRS